MGNVLIEMYAQKVSKSSLGSMFLLNVSNIKLSDYFLSADLNINIDFMCRYLYHILNYHIFFQLI